MPYNYDSTNIGIPYVRANNVTVQYPDSGIPFVTISQEKAVKLADGTIAQLGDAGSISFSVNLADQTPIPLINPTTGLPLGANTVAGQVMLGILAIIRVQQNLQNI